MITEILEPKTEQEWLELRAGNINSTDISALFGISPWATPFELWHRMKAAEVVAFEPSEYMRWGTRLQDAIASGVAEDNGFRIRRMTEYIRLPEFRLGSSFDFAIADDGLLEIKNVHGLKYRDEWLVEDGHVEAPPHIELQVQHQLALSGRKFAHIAALVGGNQIVTVKREPDPKVIEAIYDKAAKFWKSIDDNTPPAPDFAVDADFIARLYRHAEPGTIMNAKNDADIAELAHRYRILGESEKETKAARDAVKAQLLIRIGGAEKVLGEGFSISAGTVAAGRVEAYDRKEYRGFRVNWARTK